MIAVFNSLENIFYREFTTQPLLSARYKKWAVQYLDDFYKTINSKKSVFREFGVSCRTVEKVVIRGMGNN